jgi:hypothetical protein
MALAHVTGGPPQKHELDTTVCLMASNASSNRPGDSFVATFPPSPPPTWVRAGRGVDELEDFRRRELSGERLVTNLRTSSIPPR